MQDSDWGEATLAVRHAILTAWSSGMPPSASGLYSRWWQLETWIRSLVYVELRAERGANWVDVLHKSSAARQQNDDEFNYMPTTDSQDQLAYLDVGHLFQLTLDHWHLFKMFLPAKPVWEGRISELKTIRNRIGHCRRPHDDDLDRVEQTLRDLERGAFRALSSFNDQHQPNWIDPVTNGWIRNQHDDAIRLVKHAKRLYDTDFRLFFSRRPWAPIHDAGQSISGHKGYVWHATWYFRGGRPFNLRHFWDDLEEAQSLVLLVCADTASSLKVSFAATENPDEVSNAIGRCFDAALSRSLGSAEGANDNHLDWCKRYSSVDPRVHAGTPWASVHSAMTRISLFGA